MLAFVLKNKNGGDGWPCDKVTVLETSPVSLGRGGGGGGAVGGGKRSVGPAGQRGERCLPARVPLEVQRMGSGALKTCLGFRLLVV